jgi:uncharacterized protein (DUF2252 family)
MKSQDEIKVRPERFEAGRAFRKAVPRSAHGEWSPPRKRDPIGVLEGQAKVRLRQLLPIRYSRMAQSPFAFFRGAAAIMSRDLASTPSTGIRVQACGDAHVANFGTFATPERRQVFDINDFDETSPGPWEWDIKRLCTSLLLVGRERGFTRRQSQLLVLEAARAYRERLAEYCTMPSLELWYDRIQVKEVIAHFPKPARGKLTRGFKKARRKTHTRAVARLTQNIEGEQRFLEDPPLLVHDPRLRPGEDDPHRLFQDYRKSLSDEHRFLFDRYDLIDVARKVVGVGSVGTRCWIALFRATECLFGDTIVLQFKEAQDSVFEPYIRERATAHNGHRVVRGQRLIQGVSDMFLGWCTMPSTGRQYYVRQLWDMKGQGKLDTMSFGGLEVYGALCAWALARAHARTGDMAELSGYLGKGRSFDKAMLAFSEAYAKTTDSDFAALQSAIKSGRIPTVH